MRGDGNYGVNRDYVVNGWGLENLRGNVRELVECEGYSNFAVMED